MDSKFICGSRVDILKQSWFVKAGLYIRCKLICGSRVDIWGQV